MRKRTEKKRVFRILLALLLVFSMAMTMPAMAASKKKKSTTVKTTASTKKSKTRVLSTVQVKKGKLYVKADGHQRTYTVWRQNQYGGWYKSMGCVETAVSIAASGFGSKYSVKDIHKGSAKAKYSERYALKQIKGSKSLYNRAAISVRLATQILVDMGIPATARYTYNNAQAVQEITNHLRQGKPVILKCNNKKYKGVRVANGHHAVVLLSIEPNGTVTFVDPMTGKLNYAHNSHNYLYNTLSYLLEHHCSPASGNYNGAWATGLRSAGGYILVG